LIFAVRKYSGSAVILTLQRAIGIENCGGKKIDQTIEMDAFVRKSPDERAPPG